jgi:hypothetical protein
MNWEVRVQKVVNGYIVEWWEETDAKSYTENQVVFEADDSEGGELIAFVNMVHFLSDHFGVSGSKHDHYWVRCEVVDQREAEDA